MFSRSARQAALGVTIALCALALAPAAQAEDFLSALFGAFGVGRPPAPSIPLPYASEGSPVVLQGDAYPRAASMVAFSASRLVCAAMVLIRPTTSPIRPADFAKPCTVPSVSRA